MRITRRGLLAAFSAGASALVSRRAAAGPMSHVALLGDSTLDNAAYVTSGEAVEPARRRALPSGWRVSLNAIDGDVIAGVAGQLSRVPADVTHLVVSVGGNDALRSSGVIQEPARSVGEALLRVTEVRESFARDYSAMLDALIARGLPAAISTIYDAAFSDPLMRRISATALSSLNDVITREAARRGLPVIDLRVIFSEPADYVNAIEPSAEGGRKLAAAIADLLLSHDFSRRRAVLIGQAPR